MPEVSTEATLPISLYQYDSGLFTLTRSPLEIAITINLEKYEKTENKKNNDLIELDKKIYGPITIQSKSYKDIKGRKVLNVLNQENKKLIISINCDKNELDVRIPGRKWMGSKPVKEEFENNLINDFC